MNVYDYNNPLNPVGKYDPVCDSQGHIWKELFIEDHRFRYCLRCDRMERRKSTMFTGIEICCWEVNVIKPSVA